MVLKTRPVKKLEEGQKTGRGSAWFSGLDWVLIDGRTSDFINNLISYKNYKNK